MRFLDRVVNSALRPPPRGSLRCSAYSDDGLVYAATGLGEALEDFLASGLATQHTIVTYRACSPLLLVQELA